MACCRTGNTQRAKEILAANKELDFFELKKILDDAEDMFDFSEEVKEVLKPCYSFEEEKDSQFDDHCDVDSDTESGHPLKATSGLLCSSSESLMSREGELNRSISSDEEDHGAHCLSQVSGAIILNSDF